MISLAPGQDTAFLLNSLIVVIIGGMGLAGRRGDRRAGPGPGRRLRRRVSDLRRHRPHELLDHRHLRAAGRRARGAAARALREAGMNPTVSTKRLAWPARRGGRRAGADRAAVRLGLLPERDPDQGPVAGDRGREPDLPRRLRRDGLARAGRDLRRGGHGLRQPRARRRRRGRGVEPVRRAGRGADHRHARRARLRLDRGAQRGDLLPDDHARLQRARLLLLLAGHGALGLRRRQQRRPAGDRRQPGAATRCRATSSRSWSRSWSSSG